MNTETIETILRWALAVLPSIITALLFWLRSGSSVTVKLIQNPTQKAVFVYEVSNTGNTSAKDVHITFDRDARLSEKPLEHRHEMWNHPKARDLKFQELGPGERWIGMFAMCSEGPRFTDNLPAAVTAKVTYRHGSWLRRLADFSDDNENGWPTQVAGRALRRLTEGKRRKTFKLDVRDTLAMTIRPTVGFPGQRELSEIRKELERMRKYSERTDRRAHALQLDGTGSANDTGSSGPHSEQFRPTEPNERASG